MPAAYTSRDLHFMGGIHACEHAIIGLFPLLAIADRGDVGGISYTAHPQLGTPGVFIYDAIPGGAGLAEQGYRELEKLIRRTLELVTGCACEAGCPGCSTRSILLSSNWRRKRSNKNARSKIFH